MTTIAYADGIMASDSLSTISDKYKEKLYVKKLYRLADGAMFAYAGHYINGQVLLRKLQALAKTTERTLPNGPFKGVEAILVTPKSARFFFTGVSWEKETAKSLAIGSGWLMAQAILDAGGTAVEAVKAGIRRDVFSGGRIQTMEL